MWKWGNTKFVKKSFLSSQSSSQWPSHNEPVHLNGKCTKIKFRQVFAKQKTSQFNQNCFLSFVIPNNFLYYNFVSWIVFLPSLFFSKPGYPASFAPCHAIQSRMRRKNYSNWTTTTTWKVKFVWCSTTVPTVFVLKHDIIVSWRNPRPTKIKKKSK